MKTRSEAAPVCIPVAQYFSRLSKSDYLTALDAAEIKLPLFIECNSFGDETGIIVSRDNIGRSKRHMQGINFCIIGFPPIELANGGELVEFGGTEIDAPF